MSAPVSDPTLPYLQQALLNVSQQLQNITANPKPTYSIDGQSVSWESYYAMLLRSMEELRRQVQIAGGPFEFQTQAGTWGGDW